MRCGLHRCQRYCHRPPCTQKQSKAEQVEGAQDSNEQNGDDVGNNKDSDSEDCGDSVGGDDVPKSCGQPCNAELFGCSHRCKAVCMLFYRLLQLLYTCNVMFSVPSPYLAIQY